MNRDMDIIRRIALAVRDGGMEPINGVDGIETAAFAAHAQWMEEAGLIHAAIAPKDSKRYATQAVVYRLTWAGCEFADAVRDDTLWCKAKDKVLMPTASWSFAILTDWLKAEITQGLGKIGG